MTTPEDVPEAKNALAEGSEISCPRDGRVRTLNLMDVDPPGTALPAIEQIRDMELDGDEQRVVNDQDHEFLVGDFIWGKIKSHPWWPGQVHDPRDASDFAVKHGQEGRILVAFFGDGSCSWCTPSQLRPFVENFRTMSKDSSSKSFLFAVKRALDELGRLVESEMTCNCTPKGVKAGLARPVVDNAGVKAGVLVPEVNIRRLSLGQPESREILAKLKTFAEDVSSENQIERTVLTSSLSAFYRFKDGHPLQPYREPVLIEGLEDENENIDAITDDFSVPIAVPILGSLDDDCLSSPPTGSAKAETTSDDRIYHRRKQKSVAELMGENVGKSVPDMKRLKTDDARKPGRKRRVELNVSPRMRTRKVHRSENGGGEDLSSEKLECIDTSASEDDNSGKAKEELEAITTPRERKKSKYLSPPYTNLESRAGHLRSKFISETRAGELAVEIVSDSEKMHDGEIDKVDMSINIEIPRAKSDDTTLSLSDVNAPVDELLSEIRFAAIDPLHLSNEGSLDMVWDFVSALRSSTFLRGSNQETYNEVETGQKRESDSTRKKAISPDLKPCNETRLILTFPPEFPLPSRDEIVDHFSEFGRVNEKETGVVTDSRSVHIVFMKDVDAIAAFKSSVSQSPFGSGNVDYRLLRSSARARARSNHLSPRRQQPPGKAKAEDDLMSNLGSIKQKVDIMTAILENYRLKFSPEEKFILKDEMKHLMQQVEEVSEKVRIMSEKASSS